MQTSRDDDSRLFNPNTNMTGTGFFVTSETKYHDLILPLSPTDVEEIRSGNLQTFTGSAWATPVPSTTLRVWIYKDGPVNEINTVVAFHNS